MVTQQCSGRSSTGIGHPPSGSRTLDHLLGAPTNTRMISTSAKQGTEIELAEMLSKPMQHLDPTKYVRDPEDSARRGILEFNGEYSMQVSFKCGFGTEMHVLIACRILTLHPLILHRADKERRKFWNTSLPLFDSPSNNTCIEIVKMVLPC